MRGLFHIGSSLSGKIITDYGSSGFVEEQELTFQFFCFLFLRKLNHFPFEWWRKLFGLEVGSIGMSKTKNQKAFLLFDIVFSYQSVKKMKLRWREWRRDDEDVAEMGNLFDDLQLANQQLEIQTNMLVQYKDKVKLWKEKGKANNVKGCANGIAICSCFNYGFYLFPLFCKEGASTICTSS